MLRVRFVWNSLRGGDLVVEGEGMRECQAAAYSALVGRLELYAYDQEISPGVWLECHILERMPRMPAGYFCVVIARTSDPQGMIHCSRFVAVRKGAQGVIQLEGSELHVPLVEPITKFKFVAPNEPHVVVLPTGSLVHEPHAQIWLPMSRIEYAMGV